MGSLHRSPSYRRRPSARHLVIVVVVESPYLATAYILATPAPDSALMPFAHSSTWRRSIRLWVLACSFGTLTCRRASSSLTPVATSPSTLAWCRAMSRALNERALASRWKSSSARVVRSSEVVRLDGKLRARGGRWAAGRSGWASSSSVLEPADEVVDREEVEGRPTVERKAATRAELVMRSGSSSSRLENVRR